MTRRCSMKDNELDVEKIFKKYYAGKEFSSDLAHTSEHLEKFNELGYDVSERGAMFFSDVLAEVRYLYSAGASEEEIRFMIPSISLEYSNFCYEVGRNRFATEIKDFLGSKMKSKKKKNGSAKKNDSEIDIVESLLYFAKRFNAEDEKTNANSVNKQKVKVLGE